MVTIKKLTKEEITPLIEKIKERKERIKSIKQNFKK